MCFFFTSPTQKKKKETKSFCSCQVLSIKKMEVFFTTTELVKLNKDLQQAKNWRFRRVKFHVPPSDCVRVQNCKNKWQKHLNSSTWFLSRGSKGLVWLALFNTKLEKSLCMGRWTVGEKSLLTFKDMILSKRTFARELISMYRSDVAKLVCG